MKRGQPIARKTPMPAGGKRLRRGRSTGSPTKAQRKRLHDVTHAQCIACTLNRGWSLQPAYVDGCDAHHLLSGGRRRGHSATVGLCPWHHRHVRPAGCPSDKVARDLYGPSLAHESKAFHERYGSDDELLAMQDRILRANDAPIVQGAP
jgi:hypothetical protein